MDSILYGTKQAAEYLGMSVQNLKYHIYKGNINPDCKIGHSLIFTKNTLDAFLTRRALARKVQPDPVLPEPHYFDVEPF